MMDKLIVALVIVGVGLLGTSVYWMLNPEATTSTASSSPVLGVTFVQNSPDRALRPTVVDAATRLDQGRPARAGSPRTKEYPLPTLTNSAAGTALMIPPGPLPETPATVTVSRLPAASGNQRTLRFDMYSWSMGTLVASLGRATAVDTRRGTDVPAAVHDAVLDAADSQRVLLVLPVESDGLPEGLNPLDSYVVVADIGVPAS